MENIKVITTKMPTYLHPLLQENFPVKLVFRQRGKESPLVPNLSNSFNKLDHELSQLDLTGNPLQTDLGADDSINSDCLLQRPPSWSAEEAQQYPLTVEKARSFINNELQKNSQRESIYCICTSDDKEPIAGLGTRVSQTELTRFLVYVLPCYDENHEITTVEHMKKEHIKNVTKKAQIKICSTNEYDLFGYNLINCTSLDNAEHNGNISLDVFSTETQNNSQVQMNFQVIVGHKTSRFITFWHELSFIQSLIKLFEATNQLNDSTVINTENYLNYSEITSIINDLLTTVTSTKKIASAEFDLNNLRHLTVFDKLWNTMKHCQDLSDLRDCFLFFFEEIAASQAELRVWDKEQTAVSEITEGILNGKIAVPTLSFSQCLELLIELGIEKLKKDYLTIISNFAVVAKEAILKKWNELLCENAINSKETVQRKSRISINPKTSITNLTNNKLKVTFLSSMHNVCEFIFLYKENLQIICDCFYSYCESLCNQFLLNFQKKIFVDDLKQPRLCHFTWKISSADSRSFIKDKTPRSFSVKLTSVVQRERVSTVFYFSQFPIIPPCIIRDYEIPGVTDDNDLVNKLYAVKLVEYVHGIEPDFCQDT